MTATMISSRRIVRHSRRFYLQLCGWCHRSLGPAGTVPASATCRCGGAALLRVARARLATLGRPGDGGAGGGDFTPPPVRPRPARRALRSSARLAA